MLKKYTLLSILVFAVLTLGYCDENGETYKDKIIDDPDSLVESLNGKWDLSGSGKQKGCDKEIDNVAYRISFMENPEVTIEETEEKNIWNIDIVNLPEHMSHFSGEVDTSLDRVEFAFTDDGGVQPVNYAFSGSLMAAGVVEGSFSAQGPGSCVTTVSASDFTIRVR